MHSNSSVTSIHAPLFADPNSTGDKGGTGQDDNNSNMIWKVQDNTETFPTNAFGTLEFQGADVHTKKAKVL